MIQFKGSHRATFVDSGGKLIKACGVDLFQSQMGGWAGCAVTHVDRSVTNGDHSRAALSFFSIVCNLVCTGGSGWSGTDQHIRGGKDPVAEGCLFYGERGKEMRIGTWIHSAQLLILVSYFCLIAVL